MLIPNLGLKHKLRILAPLPFFYSSDGNEPHSPRFSITGLLAAAAFAASCCATTALAQSATDPTIAACKASALIALQQQAADITDLVLDMDSLAVSAADTKVEDVDIKTVILGEAYIQRKGATGKPDRFVCLIGDKGKVTFFTAK